MCWSFQASIATWIIALVTGLYLLGRRNKNDIVMGILILTYSSMQLWEAMMWYDQKCGKMNIFATKMAYFALWSHVLAIGLGLYIEYKAIWPLLIGVGLLGLAWVRKPKSFGCSVPSEVNGHLVWGFNTWFYMLVFGLAIIINFWIIRHWRTAIAINLLFIITFLLSAFLTRKTGALGSFWCWVCAFFCFGFIAVNK